MVNNKLPFNAPKTIQGKKARYYSVGTNVYIVNDGIKVHGGIEITRQFYIDTKLNMIEKGLI